MEFEEVGLVTRYNHNNTFIYKNGHNYFFEHSRNSMNYGIEGKIGTIFGVVFMVFMLTKCLKLYII